MSVPASQSLEIKPASAIQELAQKLFKAIFDKNIDQANKLLKTADSEVVNIALVMQDSRSGRTPLHEAANYQGGESHKIVLELLNKATNRIIDTAVTIQDQDGRNLLHIAAQCRPKFNFFHNLVDKSSMEALSQALIMQDKIYGLTPLHMAATYQGDIFEDSASFILLLSKLSDDSLNKAWMIKDHNGRNPFHEVAHCQTSAVLCSILDRLSKDVIDNSLVMQDYNGQTPLHLIASCQYYIAVEKLIAKSSKNALNTAMVIRDNNSNNPLHIVTRDQIHPDPWNRGDPRVLIALFDIANDSVIADTPEKLLALIKLEQDCSKGVIRPLIPIITRIKRIADQSKMQNASQVELKERQTKITLEESEKIFSSATIDESIKNLPSHPSPYIPVKTESSPASPILVSAASFFSDNKTKSSDDIFINIINRQQYNQNHEQEAKEFVLHYKQRIDLNIMRDVVPNQSYQNSLELSLNRMFKKWHYAPYDYDTDGFAWPLLSTEHSLNPFDVALYADNADYFAKNFNCNHYNYSWWLSAACMCGSEKVFNCLLAPNDNLKDENRDKKQDYSLELEDIKRMIEYAAGSENRDFALNVANSFKKKGYVVDFRILWWLDEDDQASCEQQSDSNKLSI